ncbi:MAG: molecular chaperone HtpG [Enterobacteriaceae bacterium]|nr:molecular chaperone HtpG [Enterobacteriaceae bacterium]
MTSEKLSFKFKTEIKQLLNIIINSLYKNKDTFIRELISNAYDAIEKLKFENLTKKITQIENIEYKILIGMSKKDNILIIEDNGIGMTKKELINNLGTLAKSGTRDFIEKLKTISETKGNNLIGNFGVGFYSSFIVSYKVVVETLKAGLNSKNGFRWTSDGIEEFYIENIEKTNHGTKIILHLKNDAKEFLEEYNIKSLVSKYSSQLPQKIIIKNNDTCEEKKLHDTINNINPLWVIDKSNIKDEEYIKFYKEFTNDSKDPLLWCHFKIEGKFEYTGLLYIPLEITFDIVLNRNSSGLKLYSKKVLVQEDCKELIPNYLRFIKGIIDIEYLYLNISRDSLQESKFIENIKASLIKKTLNMLNNLSKTNINKYNIFWKNYGQILKEGLIEDFANKEDIIRLIRIYSTRNLTDNCIISLDDYIENMLPEQNDEIYYLFSDNFNSAKNSSHIEYFCNNKIEVLLFVDKIDEFIFKSLNNYQKKKFISISSDELKIYDKNNDIKDVTKYDYLKNKLQDVLKENVSKINIVEKTSKYPSRIISNKNSNNQLEKLIIMSGKDVCEKKCILELNVKNDLIKILNEENDEYKFKKLAQVIFDQALILDGKILKNSGYFVEVINEFILNSKLIEK